MFLATLAIKEDTGYINVWDMMHWDPSRPEDTSTLVSECKSMIVTHTGMDEYLEDLPIGLAISADGNQVAIYQEPMVGQWDGGSALVECAFPFHLLTLKDAQDPSKSQEGATQSNQDVSGQHIEVSIDPSAKITHSNGLPMESDNPAMLSDAIHNQSNMSYEEK
ncbi:hypothetical protein BGX34_007390, partial [Mortierella sp. NVP85]